MSNPDNCPTEQPNAKPILRRSGRERKPPDFYGVRVNFVSQSPEEPRFIKEPICSPQKSQWEKAMEAEMKSLKENELWDLFELPKYRKATGSKWVYKVKTGADGLIECYKARLVAQGFSQKYGDDQDETFYPVFRVESLHALIAV